MKAVAYKTTGPIDREDALQDITLDKPQASGRDLLVQVHAVSVNLVDAKLRVRKAPEAGAWGVLGFDASGVVEGVGPEVTHFKAGDPVFYAGSITRPGTNSEYHLVDERIVGRKPVSLSDAEAAALPLTAITAWEMLFDRLDVKRATAQGGRAIHVIGGAGGVGSIAIQLLRALTDLTVIASASRPETQAWVRECGAHHVIDHRQPLAPQGQLLNEVAALVDAGRIRSTATEIAGKIDAATLRRVHAQIESGTARGKIVLEGF